METKKWLEKIKEILEEKHIKEHTKETQLLLMKLSSIGAELKNPIAVLIK